MFKKIHIESWRQFEKVEIDFHNQLTILTGANGAGKTSVLNILNSHFGWDSNFISTPEKDEKTGNLVYKTGAKIKRLLDKFFKNSELQPTREEMYSNLHKIGSITYSTDNKSDLRIPDTVGSNYNIEVTNRQNVKGLHIASHRLVYTYKQVNMISTVPKKKEQIYNEFWNLLNSSYSQHSYSDHRTNYLIKETLISLATYGYGNQVVAANENARELFEGFIEILKIVLPKKIGFKNILIQMPEVVLETNSGNFSLDAVSGGIASIIDLAWLIYMYPNDKKQNFVVTLDEPENHLHPELQKTLLPNLMQAFPNVQFIIATHNPFIISSTPDSNVYVLNYNDDNQVYSQRLDLVNKAGSSNDILRDVLGIDVTYPIWVEEKINEIIAKYIKNEFNSQSMNSLRDEMENIGLDNLVPSIIVKILDERR